MKQELVKQKPKKKCNHCGSFDTYIKKNNHAKWNYSSVDGLLICSRCYMREYHNIHKVELRKKRHAYRKTERYKRYRVAYDVRYRKKYRDKINVRARKYRNEHKDRV